MVKKYIFMRKKNRFAWTQKNYGKKMLFTY